MAGTRAGGIKARDKNLASDPLFYQRIGSEGGKNSNDGGFHKKAPCNCDILEGEHTKPMCAGTLGGRKSRRGKSKKVEQTIEPRKTYWPW